VAVEAAAEVDMSDVDSRKMGRWLLTFVMLAALSVAALVTAGRRSMRMSSATAAAVDPNELAQLAPGSKTQVVVEIASVDSKGTAEGKLLDRERDDLYRKTATEVGIKFSESTPVVMGKLADLRAGAVVHVKGTVGDDHRIAAEQIVVLTGYVQVH
jgi:hypothetical protein